MGTRVRSVCEEMEELDELLRTMREACSDFDMRLNIKRQKFVNKEARKELLGVETRKLDKRRLFEKEGDAVVVLDDGY